MSSSPSIRHALLWSAIQNWGERLSSFVIFVLLARLLDAETFGVMAIAGALVTFLQLLVENWLVDAVVQQKDLRPGHVAGGFWLNVALGSALGGWLAAGAGLAASQFACPELAPVLRWLALLLPLSALGSMHTGLLCRRMQFRSLAARRLGSSLVAGGLALVLAWRGHGLAALVTQPLVASLLSTIILWSSDPWRPAWPWRAGAMPREDLRELLMFSRSVAGVHLLNFVNARLDQLLVGYFLGPVQAGLYALGRRMLALLTSVQTGVVQQVALSWFARLQTDREQFKRRYLQLHEAMSVVCLPTFLGVFLVADPLVTAMCGPEWSASAAVIRPLMLIGVLQALCYLKTAALVGAGHPEIRLRLTLQNAIGNLVAFAVAVRWGIAAVAWAYVIRGALLYPAPLRAVLRVTGATSREYLRSLAGPLLATLAMAGAVLLTSRFLAGWNAWWVLLIESSVGAITYAAVVWRATPSLRRTLATLTQRPAKNDRAGDDSTPLALSESQNITPGAPAHVEAA